MGTVRANLKRTLGVTAICLVVSACSQSESGATDPGATTSEPERTTTTVTHPPKAPDIDLTAIPDWFENTEAAPQSLVAVISEELGAEYVGSMAVTWPTAGLGCSDGGYELQVLTPGFLIFFEDDDGLRRVHTADSGRWVECDFGRALEGLPTLNS